MLIIIVGIFIILLICFVQFINYIADFSCTHPTPPTDRIIKPEPIKVASCPECGCQFKYFRNHVYWSHVNYFIDCPNCGRSFIIDRTHPDYYDEDMNASFSKKDLRSGPGIGPGIKSKLW